MIAHIRGTVLEKKPEYLVVDVNGVGYELHVSMPTFYRVGEIGDEVSLSVYTHVREDAIVLFGFNDRIERSMFNLLIGVNKVGPRLALNILSGMEAGKLAVAISQGSVNELTKIPGLGNKTAQRLVLDLGEKVTELATEAEKTGVSIPKFDQGDHDVISALTNLGYPASLAEEALAKVKKHHEGATDIELLLRETLKEIGKSR